jgi:Putative beta-barrel porin-2, OmpL-like. bbp2
MKFNKWTVGLAAIGVVSLASAARADEKMSQLQTALSNTTISGYVDTAAQWNPGTDSNDHGVNIPTYSFAKDDGFSLNAVDIAIDHPEDESPWAAGYHVELMAGPNSEPADNQAFPGTPVARAGFESIRQAYLSLRTPVGNSGIDWKVGTWDTIIGYESSSDPANPNYTRSYGYTLEPTTETGVQANYKVNDEISAQAGIADAANADTTFGGGLNNSSVFETQKAYMGAVALTAPSSWGWLNGATLNAGVIDGEASTGAPHGTTSYYAGATVPTPISALKGGASFDYLDLHDGGGEAYALGVYGSYQFNSNTSFNLRGEYGSDDSGVLGYNAAHIPRNEFEELTGTLQYQLWANVLSRLEVRWDHTAHGDFYGASSTGAPMKSNDFLVALNLIYQF